MFPSSPKNDFGGTIATGHEGVFLKSDRIQTRNKINNYLENLTLSACGRI